MQDVLKKVIKDGFSNFAKYGFATYILAFLVLAFFVASIALSLNPMLGSLSIIATLFIAFPLLFSFVVSSFGFRRNIEGLKWGNIFRYSLSYFKRPYRGAFKIILSFMIYLAVFILAEFIFTNVAFSITLNIYPEFGNIMEQLSALTLSGDVGGLYNLINTYKVEMNLFMYISFGSCSIIALTVAVIYALKNCFYIYYLIAFPLPNNYLTRVCYRLINRDAKKYVLGYFLLVSIPLILLLLGGFTIGALVSYNYGLSFTLGHSIALMSGVGLAALYLPIFCSLNESIFLENINLYDPGQNNETKLYVETYFKEIVDKLNQAKGKDQS